MKKCFALLLALLLLASAMLPAGAATARPQVVGISAQVPGKAIAFVPEWGYPNSYPGKGFPNVAPYVAVTLHYSDGSTKVLTDWDTSYIDYETDGYPHRGYRIWQEYPLAAYSEYYDDHSGFGTIQAGTYQVTLKYIDYDADPSTEYSCKVKLTLKAQTPKEFLQAHKPTRTLAPDKKATISLGMGEYGVFTFTPQADGYYMFESYGAELTAEAEQFIMDSSGKWISSYKDAAYRSGGAMSGGDGEEHTLLLQKGKPYTVVIHNRYDHPAKITLSVRKCEFKMLRKSVRVPLGKRIEIKDVYESTFAFGGLSVDNAADPSVWVRGFRQHVGDGNRYRVEFEGLNVGTSTVTFCLNSQKLIPLGKLTVEVYDPNSVVAIQAAPKSAAPVDYIPELDGAFPSLEDLLTVTAVLANGSAKPLGGLQKDGDDWYSVTWQIKSVTKTAAALELTYNDSQLEQAYFAAHPNGDDDTFLVSLPRCTVEIPVNNMTLREFIAKQADIPALSFGKAHQVAAGNGYEVFRYTPDKDGVFGVSSSYWRSGKYPPQNPEGWIVGPNAAVLQHDGGGNFGNGNFGMGYDGAAGKTYDIIVRGFSKGVANCKVTVGKPVLKLAYQRYFVRLRDETPLYIDSLVLQNSYPDVLVNGVPLAEYQGERLYFTNAQQPGRLDTLVFTSNGKTLGRTTITVRPTLLQGFLYYVCFGWLWMQGPGWYDWNPWDMAAELQDQQWRWKTALLK